MTDETNKPKIIAASILSLSLLLNAVLIDFNADHMEARFRKYAADRLEHTAWTLRGRDHNALASIDQTLPPPVDIRKLSAIEEERAMHSADVIAQILGESP